MYLFVKPLLLNVYLKTNIVSIRFDAIEDAIADIKDGKIIIVVDDENRENEGDFIAAAECVTPEMTNFMAQHDVD